MQIQQAAQELLLTVAQISLLDGTMIAIMVILLVAFAYLVYVVRKRLSVGGSSVPQGGRRPWLEYGSFFVVILGIVAVIIGFLSVLGFLGRFADVNQALGFLTAFFGAIVGLTGTYFGIKTSADARNDAQALTRETIASDTTPPMVSTVSPLPNALGVSPTTHVTATFSKDMEPATFNTTTFKLVEKDTSTPVAGTIVYDPPTQGATFRPENPLANNTYQATITTDVKDKAGNAIAREDTWEFTVGP